MIYLDSSALLKLLVEELESVALARWLGERSTTPKVSSELAKAEVIRAARRLDPGVVPAARALISRLDLIPLRSGVISDCADIGDVHLRTLDAIHLASALAIRQDLTDFVAYDNRLFAAAESAGLAPTRPGA